MRSITPEEYKSRFIEKYGNSFTMVTPYIGMKEQITVRCNTCLAENSHRADHLIERNHHCPNCAQYKKYQYYDKLTKDIPSDFMLMNIIKQKRIIKHRRCGAEFLIDRVKFNGRCPVCDETSKFILLDSTLRKKFGEIEIDKKILIDDGKELQVDFYIPSLELYIDLYGDFLKFPMGRPPIYISYNREIFLKQEHCQKYKIKYMCIQERNDLLDVIYDINTYFKSHKCTYKSFCRWRCSHGIKKIKIKSD